MTKPQRARFFGDWWPRIAALRKVHVNNRDARHDLFEEAGLGRISAGDIDHLRGFDVLKARCLAILQDTNVNAQLRQQAQPTRRKLTRLEFTLRCLALYVTDVEAYVAHICLDKFGTPDRHDLSDRRPPPRENGEIRPSQVEQLVMTLSGRLNGRKGLRNQAGDTLHDMKLKAGLPCDCTACSIPPRPSPLTPHPSTLTPQPSPLPVAVPAGRDDAPGLDNDDSDPDWNV